MTAAILDDDYWQDYSLDDDVSAPGSAGGSHGPGTAGSRWCACGSSLSWPDGTTAEDRDLLHQMQDDHEATCPTMHTELVQPTPNDVPSPVAVAELHARHRAAIDALANDTIRKALRMMSRLRAVGLTPGPTARITASYLETAVTLHPELRTWRP